ncbi:ABC transporter substrate-binding protein [Bordetella sp. 15P40C-2]|uniref:ABC transporter substrate-binding protein n=1 Tax=Bordetella sp. 15P40C-2 TaxID=2572246 RepID=UPI001324B32E|nr:ABC transporter substrate-binding protein [Bordetella sp. 15P40C-2]MVW70406.1 ABC transporter substrate-binding protein [Bordetella sp. 15P40C-2]
MTKTFAGLRTLAATLTAAGVLLASGSAWATTTVRMAPNGDLKTLDPSFNTVYITRNHGYMVFDTLFAQDSKGEIRPQMVDTWTKSDDGKKWSFTLRDGLQFNDGAPVTAADCVASIERWAKKDTLGRLMIKAGAKLNVVNDKTFELTLDNDFGLVLAALSKPSGMPLFIMPKRLADTDPNVPITEMVGSGPFLFKKDEWVPGNKVVYVKNPNYKPRAEPADGLAGGKVAKVDRVEWVYIPDANTAAAALQNGEIDMIESVTPDFLPVLEGNSEVNLIPSLASQGMVVPNFLHPPFDNAKARQAMYHVIDQAAFVSAVGYGGKYRTEYCGSMYTCSSPFATDAGAAPYKKPDFEKAKQLLKEAGYKNEKVVILYPTDNVNGPANLVLAQALQKAGFNVDLQAMDWASVAARRLKKDAPDNGGWNIFLTHGGYFDASTPVTNPWLSAPCGNGLPGWPCDEELDKLRAQWIAEGDPAKSKELAAKIQERAYESVPYVMWGEFKPVIATRGLKNTDLMKVGIPVMWNVEK